jgi:uncharacterized membrane protein YphA (DoxX/SURF4 family)
VITEMTDRSRRFWFEPKPASTLALVRIAYGLLVLLWTISLAPDMMAFYGPEGVVPTEPNRDFRWGLFDLSESRLMAVFVLVSLLVAASCLLVGFRSRLAAVVVFVLLVSLRDRNPWHLTGGDSLLRHFGFFLMFAPVGAALSVDRWRRRRDRFWRIPVVSAWPVRLIQIQLAIVYLFTVWSKARGTQWWDGTAVGNVMHVDDLARFAVPQVVRESLLVSNVLTWGTLAVELALALLIWNRRWRPYVIAAGIALHLFLEVTMQLGFFGMTMFVGYVAFIPEDTSLRWLGMLRRRLARSTRGPLRRVAEAGVHTETVGAVPARVTAGAR